VFTVANNYLPGAGELNIGVLNLVGLTAIVLGLVANLVPWHRWSPSAPIVLAPLAFTLIAVANRFGGVSQYSYAVYFVLAFTWVGLAFPPKTSFLLAPFATIAYVVPSLTTPHGPAGSVSSVTVAIPVCLLVAETVARTVQKVVAAVETSHRQEAALHEAEARFRLAFTNAPIGMSLTSLHGQFLQVNEALCHMLGRSEEQLAGALVPSLTHPDDQAADRAAMAEMRAGKRRTFHTEKRYLRPDGEPVWVRLHAGVVLGEDGRPRYFVSQMEDITERKRTEAALREEAVRFRLSFDNAPIGKALVAPDGRFLEVNPALCGIVGYTRDELLATTLQDITHPDDLDVDLELVRQLMAGDLRTYSMEKRYFHADGHVLWINLSVSLVRDDSASPLYFISQIEDITARKAMEDELARLATMDELTGLRNRRGFLAVAEPLARMAERNQQDMALLYIDLDNLKRINDEHGHMAGDQALIALADLLRGTFRDSDVLARWGGDEFVVLLPDARLEATVWLDRLRELAGRDPRFSQLSFSVGVAVYEWEHLASIDALIHQADAAMYKQKTSKRRQPV
jgi:diguanylate cyclase (GGDEF)-like protein/PAS domain S-box-containing protein